MEIRDRYPTARGFNLEYRYDRRHQEIICKGLPNRLLTKLAGVYDMLIFWFAALMAATVVQGQASGNATSTSATMAANASSTAIPDWVYKLPSCAVCAKLSLSIKHANKILGALHD